ncbi:carboxymuconolactone decarboxylase family protein [Kitasatospora fiedleri]|uniref:carboxymuconolactone decarboxylase family protein n=1 Tax=Kitasatospora fiedleri TaxID=2991545 RepID=UPI00249BFDA4|nr:carboxymuconolactone decarboxylase family protein [Kitasatospora fiedleri]
MRATMLYGAGDVLLADVWQHPGPSPRERNLIIVAALVVPWRDARLRRSLDNGPARAELAETTTHPACYAGWPAAMGATTVPARATEADDRPTTP